MAWIILTTTSTSRQNYILITNSWQRQSYALISNLRSSPRWAPSLPLSSRPAAAAAAGSRRSTSGKLSAVFCVPSLSLSLLISCLFCSLSLFVRFFGSLSALSLSLQLTKVSSFFVRLLCIGLFSKIYSFSLGFDDFGDTYILISSSLVSFWIWKKSWKHVNDVNERNYIIIQLLGMIILFIFWFFLFGVCGFFYFIFILLFGFGYWILGLFGYWENVGEEKIRWRYLDDEMRQYRKWRVISRKLYHRIQTHR